MARTLEELAALDFVELGGLYRKAKFPAKVEGDCRGRMLATNPRSHMAGFWKALEGIAGEPWFPWQGKSFEDGSGINRITPLQFRLFRFETRKEPSLEDGKPALLLDYDQPGNPFVIRRVRDEIREVSPGLLLGQMYVVTTQPRLTLYFGLETPP